MKISAVFADGSKMQVDGWTYAPTTPLTANDTEITISYTAFGQTWTAKQGITVEEISRVLNDNTWDKISRMSVSGRASTIWSIGDVKEITLNGTIGIYSLTNYKTWVYILGFNHNAEKEGNNLIHFGCFKRSKGSTDVALTDSDYDVISGNRGFVMNDSRSNNGGWKICHMRTTVIDAGATSPSASTGDTFLHALPNDLKAVMKRCTKYTYNAQGGQDIQGYVTATQDWAFLLSEFEVQGRRIYASRYEQDYQKQYEYYRLGGSPLKVKSTTDNYANWWSRSLAVHNNEAFCYITIDGTVNYSYARYSYGFSPAFCV